MFFRISDASTIGESFTTNITCGGLSSGTAISSSDKLNDLVYNMVYRTIPEPSTEYEDKLVGEFGTLSDVDTFFTTHTYYNGWAGLKLGNYIAIDDSVRWVIAGFNCETATDGIPGGIAFIAKSNYSTRAWATGYQRNSVPYMNSDIHSYINSTLYNNLSTILGSHIVQRNVMLGSECSGTSPRYGTTSATTNTTAYLTLMSWGQLSGRFGSHNNSYDDGEANYKLPLFNHISISTYLDGDYSFWLRNVYGKEGSLNVPQAYIVNASETTQEYTLSSSFGNRPLMYLR